MIKAIKEKNIVLAPLCNDIKCQDWIKDKTGGAKTLNMPLDQPSIEGKKCAWCGKAAEYFVYVGKSY